MGDKYLYIGLKPDPDKRKLLIQAVTELARSFDAWERIEGRTNRAELKRARADLLRAFNRKYNMNLQRAIIV
jgi:hypothetical protein